jgi:hypothetical protein
MKWFFFLVMIGNVYATTFSQIRSTPEGTSEQGFTISKTNISYVKRSNYFDSSKSLTLGEFGTSNAKAGLAVLPKLQEALVKIKQVDKFMRKKNSSFNEMSEKSPHEPYFLLDDYRITSGSILYKELEANFKKLESIHWKQKSGIKLSDDFKTVTKIENEKESSKTEFNFRLHCKNPQAPTICIYKDHGILFLK